jgi:hypothetical protein
MQLDAHCVFSRHWDTDVIAQWHATHNRMAVLTSYLSSTAGALTPGGDAARATRPIMCSSAFARDTTPCVLRHGVQPESSPTVTVRIAILPHLALTPSPHIYSCPCRLSSVHSHQTMPMLQPFWAAGFAFSRGHFVLRVPYDPYLPMLFQVPNNADGMWERQHMMTRPSPALPPTTHLSLDSLRRTGGGN